MFWYATGLCCPKRQSSNRISPEIRRKRSVSSPEPIVVEHRPSQDVASGDT